MARSRALVLGLLLTACSPAIDTTPASPASTPASRTAPPTEFNEAVLRYKDTFGAYLAAYNAGQFAEAYALIGEYFLFGGDCEYGSSTISNIDTRATFEYWLRARIADHDRIDPIRFVEVPNRDAAIGVFIERTNDTIRERFGVPSVKPRAPLVVRFSPDGRRIIGLSFLWSTQVARFSDCLP